MNRFFIVKSGRSARIQNAVLVLLVIIVLLSGLIPSPHGGAAGANAFVQPAAPSFLKRRVSMSHCPMYRQSSLLLDSGPSSSSSSVVTTFWKDDNLPVWLVADADVANGIISPTDDETLFAPFTDQINYLDGPILAMLGISGVVLVALVGFKLLTDQMDSAIEKVLVDFEGTMKESYPQRWQSDIRPQLEQLQGEARQQKLVQIMEELQSKDPEFMRRVEQKMKK